MSAEALLNTTHTEYMNEAVPASDDSEQVTDEHRNTDRQVQGLTGILFCNFR